MQTLIYKSQDKNVTSSKIFAQRRSLLRPCIIKPFCVSRGEEGDKNEMKIFILHHRQPHIPKPRLLPFSTKQSLAENNHNKYVILCQQSGQSLQKYTSIKICLMTRMSHCLSRSNLKGLIKWFVLITECKQLRQHPGPPTKSKFKALCFSTSEIKITCYT